MIAGLVSVFSLMFLLILSSCSAGTDAAADCDPHIGPCTKEAGGYTVMLDISPKPVVHMEELTFDVSLSGAAPESDTLLLDLSMPGMDMGKNQVPLNREADNHYRGQGIIVKCPSGRTLWRATLLISETLKPDFTFNVRD